MELDTKPSDSLQNNLYSYVLPYSLNTKYIDSRTMLRQTQGITLCLHNKAAIQCIETQITHISVLDKNTASFVSYLYLILSRATFMVSSH